MRHLIVILIIVSIFYSCGEKEGNERYLHSKTTPYTCDDSYFVKLGENIINPRHVVISANDKEFYTISDSGVIKFEFDGLKKQWRKDFHFGSILKQSIRPDRKIWILALDVPGYSYRYKNVHLIDTLGNVILTKKVNAFANNIVSVKNEGFILAYTLYDSTAWVNYAHFENTGKYCVELYDKNGNEEWKKYYNHLNGEIRSLCFLNTSEILVGGKLDSISGDYGPEYGYLTKMDNLGNVKWTKLLPEEENKKAYIVSDIFEETQNNYSIVVSNNEYSFLVIRMDSSGLINHKSEIKGYYKGYNNILCTSDSNIIVTYELQNNIYMSCLNALGDVLWSNNFGGDGYESPSSIFELNSKDILLFGSSENYDGIRYNAYINSYIIKTDKYGNSCY
jgi:hypothetical protein